MELLLGSTRVMVTSMLREAWPRCADLEVDGEPVLRGRAGRRRSPRGCRINGMKPSAKTISQAVEPFPRPSADRTASMTVRWLDSQESASASLLQSATG